MNISIKPQKKSYVNICSINDTEFFKHKDNDEVVYYRTHDNIVCFSPSYKYANNNMLVYRINDLSEDNVYYIIDKIDIHITQG